MKSFRISSTDYLQHSEKSHVEFPTSNPSHILPYLMRILTSHLCISILLCVRNSISDSISRFPLPWMGFPCSRRFPPNEADSLGSWLVYVVLLMLILLHGCLGTDLNTQSTLKTCLPLDWYMLISCSVLNVSLPRGHSGNRKPGTSPNIQPSTTLNFFYPAELKGNSLLLLINGWVCDITL